VTTARWVTASAGECFLPADDLFADAYRARVLAGLERLRERDELALPGRLGRLRHPDAWAAFVAGLAARRWHVYAKTTLRGGEAYAYLARYAGRVAVSNGRLLAYDGQTVTIATKAGHPPVVLSGVELLRRFALHVLPRRFLRIRHYGLFNARQRELLALARDAIRAQGLEDGSLAAPDADAATESACEPEPEPEAQGDLVALADALDAPTSAIASTSAVTSSAITEVALGGAPLTAVLALVGASATTPAGVPGAAKSTGAGETWQELVLRTQGKDVTRCARCGHDTLVRVDLDDLDADTYSRVVGVSKPRRSRRGRGYG
jgi:hypothetical protein